VPEASAPFTRIQHGSRKDHDMSRSSLLLTAGALVLLATAASAQTKTLPGERQTMTATVEAIEESRREVTLRDAKGELHTYVLGKEVTRFPAIKVGDKVNATYYDTITLRVKPAGEPDVDTLTEGVTPGGGRKPVGTAAVQQTITATIDAIDMNVPSISFKGPRGWKYSTKVQDKKALAQVKVGDKVDITWTEALLVGVSAGK
jgi:hypothetical protein